MHNYSINSDERKTVPFFLALLSIILAWIIHLVNIPWWIDAPAVMGCYGLLYTWFDRKLWKVTFIRMLFSIHTPIIIGVWTGELNSSTQHAGGTARPFVLTVCQTWTEMKLALETDTSHSNSIEGSIILDHADKPMIYYQYENRPRHGTPDTMHIHSGSVQAWINNPNEMYSEYYSGRDRQNTGSFTSYR